MAQRQQQLFDVFRVDIETGTKDNTYYRDVIYQSGNLQLVLMSVNPNVTVPDHGGMEIHPTNDQFIRIEDGIGELKTGLDGKNGYELKEGIAVIVPANTYHLIINKSNVKPLKFYTLYAPPNADHKPGERKNNPEKPPKCEPNTTKNEPNTTKKELNITKGGCGCSASRMDLNQFVKNHNQMY